jgi:hypothetical protein
VKTSTNIYPRAVVSLFHTMRIRMAKAKMNHKNIAIANTGVTNHIMSSITKDSIRNPSMAALPSGHHILYLCWEEKICPTRYGTYLHLNSSTENTKIIMSHHHKKSPDPCRLDPIQYPTISSRMTRNILIISVLMSPLL